MSLFVITTPYSNIYMSTYNCHKTKCANKQTNTGLRGLFKLETGFSSNFNHTGRPLVSKNHYPKLAPHYYGTFQVLAQVGQVTNTLDLRPQSCIHLTFHVSLFKTKIGNHTGASTTLSLVYSDDTLRWSSKKILQCGMFKRANKSVTRWLIKWEGLPEHDATWEDADSILVCFPEFVA